MLQDRTAILQRDALLLFAGKGWEVNIGRCIYEKGENKWWHYNVIERKKPSLEVYIKKNKMRQLTLVGSSSWLRRRSNRSLS